MSTFLAPTADTPVGQFAEALASQHPTPGGGAAAAVAASLAASLTEMVIRLSIDRPRYQEHTDLHTEALQASERARRQFLSLADDDAAAYGSYRAARDLPRTTESEIAARDLAIGQAARDATAVPLTVVRACHAQIQLAERLVGRSNVNVASDLEVAALLLEGAARSAASNVLANLPSIGDDGYADAIRAELDQRLQQIQGALDRTRERLARGGPREPEVT